MVRVSPELHERDNIAVDVQTGFHKLSNTEDHLLYDLIRVITYTPKVRL